ncbi:MAG TPA: histidine kinase [Gaiellaceae bacterium]|nr:histidine kinase [Gaiellaceae bacterium]
MIRRLGVPRLVVAASAAVFVAYVLVALTGHGTGWLLLVSSVFAGFLAGRTPVDHAGTLAFGLLLAGIAVSQSLLWDDGIIVPEILLTATLFLAGRALRGRELLTSRLLRQADELEAERDAYAQLSIRYERARIAAELHDVVAHAVSMMVVQASAGQRLAGKDPVRTEDTFQVIAAAARQAQSDLDRLADLLATDTSHDENAHLGLVREIVDSARASGLPVTLRLAGDTSRVTGTVAHTALRVVQEGLTNALRYAPGAAVDVVVEARPNALEISVSNGKPVATPRLELGSGRGLTGLRERLSAVGGTLHAGPDSGEGWSVDARIPSR